MRGVVRWDGGADGRGCRRREARCRAGLGDWLRPGCPPRGRAGGLRGDQGACFRLPWSRCGGQSAYPLRGISESRQHACHHGAVRHRRRAGRRCQPRLRRIRQDLPLSAGTGLSGTPGRTTTVVVIAFSIVLIITSMLMVLLVLLHKGKDGGLSDLFGGGMSSSLGSSSVVERNLDRITIACGVLWFICIVALGLLLK